MSVRKIAAVVLVFVVAGGMPAAAVGVQDAAPAQDESDSEALTVSELSVVVIELDNVTVRNLSVESLNVSAEGADAPSSIDGQDVTLSATLRDVQMQNVTIRNDSLATRLLGGGAQSLQDRAPNETIETGQALANASLSNHTIDGAAFESVTVRNVSGNVSLGDASTGNQTAAGNETGGAPELEAANVTIGEFVASEAAADQPTETPVENTSESAEGGASDVIIGDENLTQPSWANKTGYNETDVTGSGNWTNGTAGNTTQIGGEVGQDLTSGNESSAANTSTESAATDNATESTATNASSGNASLTVDG